MSGLSDWAKLGAKAEAEAEAAAATEHEYIRQAQQAQLAKETSHQTALNALKLLQSICERNGNEYNEHVSHPAYQLSIKSDKDEFSIEKGNGVVHVRFWLDSSDWKHLTSSREDSMTRRNLHLTRFDIIELDGVAHFGKTDPELAIAKVEEIAKEACKWVIETSEANPSFKAL
jgi:hypothetical protein